MACSVCFVGIQSYTVQCGSDHVVCDKCEVTYRMKETPTRQGRILKCPICKIPETKPGRRTSFSYEYELKEMYKWSRQPVIEPAQWQDISQSVRLMSDNQQTRMAHIQCCESGVCLNYTVRKCSYPDGCSRYVCTSCTMCVSHFS
jgi:hypothetical protein